MGSVATANKAASRLPFHFADPIRAARREADGPPELAALVASLLFAVAWLMPNHYAPWATFHSDAAASLALLVASLGALVLVRDPPRWPLPSVVLLGVATIPLVQFAVGRIAFLGDAVVASAYVAGLALAVQAGAALQARARSALVPLLVALLLTGLVSVVFGVLQWLRLNDLGILVIDLEREGRPYANFAQPNQFATFLLLAMAAAFVLHERGIVSRPALMLAAAFLSVGAVMAQSRAAWLEMIGLVVLGLSLRRRARLRVTPLALLTAGAVFLALALGWSTLCEALYLPNVRDGTMGSSNGRVDLWRELLVAVRQEPVWGWGWNQVSVAQAAVAGSLPPFRLMVEHSHNLAIDLLLWNGVPIGLALIAASLWWLWRHLRACRDGETAWLLGAVVAFGLHALVEFPHDYAYLLFPVGLIAGAVEASSGAGRFVALPRVVGAVFPVAGFALLAAVTFEYFTIEDNYRDMRFESARIGTAEVSTSVPPLVLLTQLREFLYVARHQVEPGMSEPELERIRRVAERYAYPPVLLRHALAEALNGQPARAADAMRRLCHLHIVERCVEGLDNWASMAAGTYPQIAAVPLPPRPAP